MIWNHLNWNGYSLWFKYLCGEPWTGSVWCSVGGTGYMSIRKQYYKNRNILPIIIHCTHYLSSHYLARSLQLISEISATYCLVCYLPADSWLICRLHTQCMISKSNVKIFSMYSNGVFVEPFSSKQCVIKQLQDAVFFDIQNNEGLGKCYQPRPWAWLIHVCTSYCDLIFLDITKTSSKIGRFQ